MNTIVLRIADFLKHIPPFSFLTKEEQLSVAQSIKVVYFDVAETVFPYGGAIEDLFYLVKEGAIGLYAENQQLSDECDEGDIFGLRALIRQGTYKLAARATEESILYAIPSEVYAQIISKNPAATAFVAQSFANNLIRVTEEPSDYLPTKAAILEEESMANYSNNPVTCSEETTIQAAAQVMTQKRVGSIIVVHERQPIGIITDKDLRTKIATGQFSIQERVTAIMSTPVRCYPNTITVAEAQIAMLKHNITHLCITEDGTPVSDVIGLLSEHDIVLLRANNPSTLIRAIERCFSVEKLVEIRQKTQELLKRYLQQQASIVFVAKVVSEINDALTRRAIEIALEALGAPPVPFAWMALGSQGRREQMLLTDQDNALVFEDGSDNESTRAYFLSLAEKVTHSLHEIGFEYCPADMMASNPRWCLSVSEWEQQYKKWIFTPTDQNILLCSIFFDFQPIYGAIALSDRLMQTIHESIQQSPIFLKFLGRSALQNPAPLGFFRQFLVEQSGEHKDQFDIKARAMMPLVDAARLLCLEQGLNAKNTIERFKQLMDQEPQNEDLYLYAIEAFQMLLLFRTQQGFDQQNSGRFIDLSNLNKLERLGLKNSFKALNELQQVLQMRFQLANFI